MTRRTLPVCLVPLAGLMAAMPLAALAAAPKEPSPEEIAKIEAAAASLTLQVKPAKPRRLLVFSISWGFFHTSIPYGKAAAQALAAKTGAFEAVVSDDPTQFEPERLKDFDAVFFNNTNNEIFLPQNADQLPPAEKQEAARRDEALKRSFAAWLASGKGLAVIHARVASFRQWPEYGEIVGARFTNHPWGSGSTVGLKIDDPDHPLARAFKGRPLQITDEIYQLADPYSRDKVRVILSLDTAKTDMTKPGIQRTDGDFAMTYVKTYGQGRVFYNAFGHEHKLFWDPVILQHWLDGLQFALGDLQADTTPSAKARPAAK